MLVAGDLDSARAEAPRIRPLDARVARLLAAGSSESPTFRRLVDRLERSDVIVHLESWPLPAYGGRIAGLLRFVAYAGGFRYLRITLATNLSGDGAVALLGHELQHALEVASDSSVVSTATFEALYRRIGEECRSAATLSYDTRGARDAQHRIARELREASPRAERSAPEMPTAARTNP